MTDFLLELRSEEIPARMQDKARDDLARLFSAELEKVGLRADAIVTFATPRRLALIARDLPAETAAVSEEVKGPRVGAPPQALEGFLRKTGLTQDQLVERDGVSYAVIDKPGRATADVLAEAIAAIVRAFPWPKSMRWGAASTSTESLRWVRPLHGIVALLGEDVVSVEIAGVQSGAATLGHRFHHPGVITIGSAADYEERLRACYVIVDQDERRAIIRERAAALAGEAGLALIEDEGLVAENAGLTEWPVPLLGRFDEAFLEVPPEVIQLTARVNQKYFVCRGSSGKLANAFICTANIDAADGGAMIIEGNRKVLAARLSDARFFWDQDRSIGLANRLKSLADQVYQQGLGSVADYAERLGSMANWLIMSGAVDIRTSEPKRVWDDATANFIQSDPDIVRRYAEKKERLAQAAETAAKLSKADLATAIVGEFPELQGVAGSYLARGEWGDAVASAISSQHEPLGPSYTTPAEPVSLAVAISDKLLPILRLLLVHDYPTGSKDPYAIRRAALSFIKLVIDSNTRISIDDQLVYRFNGQVHMVDGFKYVNPRDLFSFFADRLKVQQREAGVRHDLIDAVFALGGEDDLVRLLARVRALQAFVGTEDGANLLAGYKRAANILKKEGVTSSRHPGLDPGSRLAGEEEAGHRLGGRGDENDATPQKQLSYTPESAETALIAALDAAEPAAALAVQAEDFEAAMAALASLRAPIDAFFDNVTVNDPLPDKRSARLALLARVRDAVHGVADFSKIEG